MQVFFHFIAKKIKKPQRSPVRCHRLIGGAPVRCRVLPRVRPQSPQNGIYGGCYQ